MTRINRAIAISQKTATNNLSEIGFFCCLIVQSVFFVYRKSMTAVTISGEYAHEKIDSL